MAQPLDGVATRLTGDQFKPGTSHSKAVATCLRLASSWPRRRSPPSSLSCRRCALRMCPRPATRLFPPRLAVKRLTMGIFSVQAELLE